MKLYEIIGIICLIIIGATALIFLGDPRFKHTAEGFESGIQAEEPVGTVGSSRLSPDINDEGPAHLLKDKIQNTRPLNEVGTLTQQQCFEQDGHRIPEKLGDYNQRTNNYVHTYPDSCSSPFKELVGSFYAPREGAIGSPVPKGRNMPASTKCRYGQ
jgi:hypothetical protein